MAFDTLSAELTAVRTRPALREVASTSKGSSCWSLESFWPSRRESEARRRGALLRSRSQKGASDRTSCIYERVAF